MSLRTAHMKRASTKEAGSSVVVSGSVCSVSSWMYASVSTLVLVAEVGNSVSPIVVVSPGIRLLEGRVGQGIVEGGGGRADVVVGDVVDLGGDGDRKATTRDPS